jgi:hypothetical protein
MSNADANALTTQSLFSDFAITDSEYPWIAFDVASYGSLFFIIQIYEKYLIQKNMIKFFIKMFGGLNKITIFVL